MESWHFALAVSAVLITTACLAVPQAMAAWRRRGALKRFHEPRVLLPAADETAAAITRFRRAVRHSDMSDYLGPDRTN